MFKKIIMENNTRIAVGLDIGTTKITVIVGLKNEHGKIEILGWVKPHQQVLCVG